MAVLYVPHHTFHEVLEKRLRQRYHGRLKIESQHLNMHNPTERLSTKLLISQRVKETE